jgi:hypothetical protein
MNLNTEKSVLIITFLILAFNFSAFSILPAQGYDYGDPSPAEQAMLEAINRARLNPQEEAARLGIGLFHGVPAGKISGEPVQPLAFNAGLYRSASLHSEDMLSRNYFAHTCPAGRTPFDRMKAQGYEFRIAGENLAMYASSTPRDEAQMAMKMHDSLFIDTGIDGCSHRTTVLQPEFREAGIGIASGPYKGFPYGFTATCDFGRSSERSDPFLLGAVYSDDNGDRFYTAGEGLGGVVISITGTGQETVTASAGGYAVPLEPGSHSVEAILPDGRTLRDKVNISHRNVKLDFEISNAEGASETIVVESERREVNVRFEPGQMVHLKCKAEPGEKIWVLIEAPSAFPNVVMARASQSLCRQKGRYVFVFSNSGHLSSDSESLYFARSCDEAWIDFGVNDFSLFEKWVFTIKKGRSPGHLETVQKIELTSVQ